MPLSKQNRFITFLVCMSLAFLVNATYVATINDGNMTSTQERIVTACLLGATFAAGFARLEYIARKTKHDLRSDVNAVGLYAQHAANEAEAAAKEARTANETMPERVVKKINGGLERAALKALTDSPVPSTDAEWERVVDRVLDRAIERGWKPPEQS